MNACQSSATLKDLLLGELPPDEAESVRIHLSSCDSCLGTLDRLTDDPELDAWLAEAPNQPSGAIRKQALDSIQKHRSVPGLPGLPGSMSLGPYQIEEEIGRGGMGVVYRARDRTIDRVVALKVLRRELVDDQARERFVREARAAARVEHDNVVRVYSIADSSDAVPYLAMEYVRGPSLAGLIKIKGRLDPREAARIVAEAADGLAAAHESGLVHRDIKPDNILIDEASGRAKIGDFGLARLAAADHELTREGVVAGTPAYLSPEQARCEPTIGPAADLYALGVTLYECLSGEPPFRGTPLRVVQQILEAEPRPPRSINEAVARDLETICLKAMAKEVGRRYVTSADLASDLRRWLAGEPILARRVGPIGRLWRLGRRYPRVAALLTALALTLVGGISGITWQWRRADHNARQYREASLRAERSYREARDAVDRFYTRMLVEKTLDKPGLEGARADVVRSMLDYYREFLRRHADDPSLLADSAEASFRVAKMTQDVGDKRETIGALGQARTLLEALCRERPGDVTVRIELAKCIELTGVMLTELGRFDEALDSIRTGTEIYRQILAIEPANPEYRRRLGAGLGNLANLYCRHGKRSLALEAYQQAREQQEIQVRLHPDHLDDRSYLALTLHNMSMLIDDPEEMDRVLREVLVIRQGIVDALPSNPYYRRNLARTQTLLAESLMGQGRFAEALGPFDEAIVGLRRLHQTDPVNLHLGRDLAQAINGRVDALIGLDRHSEAIAAASEGFELLSEMARIDPGDVLARECLASLRETVASAHETLGQLEAAIFLRNARLESMRANLLANPQSRQLIDMVAAESLAIERLTSRLQGSRKPTRPTITTR